LSTVPSPAPQKSLRGTGPIIVVILLLVAAALGYYQIVYYPAHAPTIAGPRVIVYDPHNVTVTILPGAQQVGTSRDKTYSPNAITVIAGYNATVFWINNDTVEHTVTANASDSSLDPNFTAFGPTTPPYNNIVPGALLNYTFVKPGTYGYFCSYHSWMIATVIVKPGNASSAVSTGSTSISTSVAAIPGGFPHLFLAVREYATDLASSLANLIGSGTAPWSVNLSRIFLASSRETPAALTKTG
jgi:plastocyanin